MTHTFLAHVLDKPGQSLNFSADVFVVIMFIGFTTIVIIVIIIIMIIIFAFDLSTRVNFVLRW